MWNRGKFDSKRTPFPKSDLIKNGHYWEETYDASYVQSVTIFLYSLCGHTGILKASLSSLPLCTVFWSTKKYLADSYFSSRPLENDCILGDIEQF